MGRRQRRREREQESFEIIDSCAVTVGAFRNGTLTTATWRMEPHLYEVIVAYLTSRIGVPQEEQVMSEADVIEAQPDRMLDRGTRWHNEMTGPVGQ
jgi:hypothetical protein